MKPCDAALYGALHDLVSTARFVAPQRFATYIRAQRLCTVRGFERLVSLDALPELCLYPHQEKAVFRILRDMRGRGILADEVGLGKTVEAGAVLSEYLARGLVRKALILVPASLVEQWRSELKAKFGLVFRTGPMTGGRPLPDKLLLSLDLAKRSECAGVLCGVQWDMVIVDEAHRLKNPRTANYALVRNLSRKFLILLTATPVQNNLRELYHLVDLVRPGQFTTWRSFRKQFVRGPQNPVDIPALRKLLDETMVRNTRSRTLIKFPKRHVIPVQVKMPPGFDRAYGRLLESARRLYRQGEGAKRLVPVTLLKEAVSSPESVLGTLRKLSLDAKDFESLVSGRSNGGNPKMGPLLKTLAHAGKKAVIFTEYLPTMRSIARNLEHTTGLDPWQFHGSLTRREKEETIRSFESADAGVMISTDAGSEGLNLQFCDSVINFDLPWNPMKIEQRIGRVHRLGRGEGVMIYNIILAGTIEERILELLVKKLRMFEAVVGELDSILGGAEGSSIERRFGLAVLESESEAELEARLDAIGRELEGLREKCVRAKDTTASIIDGSLKD